jgi:hypothetical protein
MDPKIIVFVVVIVAVGIFMFMNTTKKELTINGKKEDCYVTALGRVRCRPTNMAFVGVILLFIFIIGIYYYLNKNNNSYEY